MRPRELCGSTTPEAPLTSARMIELMLEAGLPAGVVNLVHGGREVGSALVAHPDVAKVTFTGSTVTGQTILRSSADTMKKVTLELGGKSDDHHARRPRSRGAGGVNGLHARRQPAMCRRHRLLVYQSLADDVAKALAKVVEAMKGGSAFEKGSEVPPIVSRAQRDKLNGYVASGLAEGAVAHSAPLERTDGFFVAPTLFTEARPGMRIVDEEIFGPVGVMMTFREDDEAVADANRLSYGIAASVWSRHAGTAHPLADRIQSGRVWVNTIFELDNMAPFGGYKMSGLSRELGAESIDAFTQSKTVALRY